MCVNTWIIGFEFFFFFYRLNASSGRPTSSEPQLTSASIYITIPGNSGLTLTLSDVFEVEVLFGGRGNVGLHADVDEVGTLHPCG